MFFGGVIAVHVDADIVATAAAAADADAAVVGLKREKKKILFYQ